MDKKQYMKRALALAEKGYGFVNPNPVVGAVIVKEGKIIGEGYHKGWGLLHAERNAIHSCSISPNGATMYVTLEPCCHRGKTPPCTEAIIKSGIREVVVGVKDPNPLVAGQGIQQLKQHGVTVVEKFMEEECRKQNEVFFHFVQKKKPYVVMKYAMTMDGKIASYTGKAKWITGEKARENVHKDRHRYTGIMTGVGTVRSDNPMLTCRIENGKNPIRIVCDTSLRTQLDAKIVMTAREVPTIFATACKDQKRKEQYLEKGCQIINISKEGDHINLTQLMEELAVKGVDSILLEGGGILNWAALSSGIVNKVQTYISPKILGGNEAKTPVMGLGKENPNEAFILKNSNISCFGEDMLIESEVVPYVYRHN